jgi:hypothetical protein
MTPGVGTAVIAAIGMTIAGGSAGILWGIAGQFLVLGLVLVIGAMFVELDRRIARAIETAFFNSKRD